MKGLEGLERFWPAAKIPGKMVHRETGSWVRLSDVEALLTQQTQGLTQDEKERLEEQERFRTVVKAAMLAVAKLDEADGEETVWGDDYEALALEARQLLLAALSDPDTGERS